MTTGELHLFHNGAHLGTLVRSFYETPWATAWLLAEDPATIPRYAAIDAFLQWNERAPDDLPVAEADARYGAELAARGLDAAEVDGFWSGWQIRGPDGAPHEVSLYRFEADGSITWRW